jgi:hypothetical protein
MLRPIILLHFYSAGLSAATHISRQAEGTAAYRFPNPNPAFRSRPGLATRRVSGIHFSEPTGKIPPMAVIPQHADPPDERLSLRAAMEYAQASRQILRAEVL